MLHRPRRNRKSETIRNLVQETHVFPSQLILPLFLKQGQGQREQIASLPNSYRMSLDVMLEFVAECVQYGICTFDIFPVVEEKYKDKLATYSYQADNFYLEAIRTLKQKFPQIVLMSDVAMDPYSSDGHDGIYENGEILNDATLEVLGKMALAQAKAGIDIIGPSDMMDGRVGYLRQVLDEAGYTQVSIMSYCAKYASAFYGPFRDALSSAPKFGDKKTYQLNPANKQEARWEAELDEAEGADFLMIKPALLYLDVIQTLRETSLLPIAAYHVSGECALLIAAAEKGWIDYERGIVETLTSIKRAGAQIIITYFALEYAKWFAKNPLR